GHVDGRFVARQYGSGHDLQHGRNIVQSLVESEGCAAMWAADFGVRIGGFRSADVAMALRTVRGSGHGEDSRIVICAGNDVETDSSRAATEAVSRRRQGDCYRSFSLTSPNFVL